MKIWRFPNPWDHAFAIGERRGSWTTSAGGVCRECGDARQGRAQPLILEWQPGSSVVGDFTWPGFDDDVVVTERLFNELRARFGGFESGPMRMVQDPKLKRTPRAEPRVWLPYEGPPLVELWVTAWAHMDPERSSVEFERRCGTCGREFWDLYGVERWDSDWDAERMELVDSHSDRLPSAGVFVPEAELEGADIFRVHEFSGWMFCTDAVREFVLSRGFTNVSFLEMGDTV